MPRLLAKNIAEAAAKKSGIDPRQLELYFDTGLKIWYWGGNAAIAIDHTCTHMVKLNDWSLERWIEDWVYEVREFEKVEKTTLTEYLESIDWNIDSK